MVASSIDAKYEVRVVASLCPCDGPRWTRKVAYIVLGLPRGTGAVPSERNAYGKGSYFLPWGSTRLCIPVDLVGIRACERGT